MSRLRIELLADIGRDQTWFEMKVLRRYEALFRLAVGSSPDINHLVAIWTRRLVERSRPWSR